MRARYNPTLSSQWFIVPGIVAVLTQVVTLLVIGLSVAREREAGTFDQLLVTPMRQIDILLGKGLPGLLIGGIEASVIILAAVLWFAVPLRGWIFALYLGLFLFVAAVTGIGLMISSLAVTQQQALLGAFLFMVPSIILSGFATPIANMPVVAVPDADQSHAPLPGDRAGCVSRGAASSISSRTSGRWRRSPSRLWPRGWLFRRRVT